jgi:hypothetical protein
MVGILAGACFPAIVVLAIVQGLAWHAHLAVEEFQGGDRGELQEEE